VSPGCNKIPLELRVALWFAASTLENMANSHWDHNSGYLHNGQWSQAPQHSNLAWNPLAASLPRAGYVNSNYYASLQSMYGQGIPSVSSQQPRSTSMLNAQIPSGHTHLDLTPRPTPPVRSFRHGPGGPQRCAHPGCPWSGPTPKALETHKMDRHLIFPPGWKPRKGPPDGEGGYAFLPPFSFPTDFSWADLIRQSPVQGSP
jgi:hypothetical protein